MNDMNTYGGATVTRDYLAGCSVGYNHGYDDAKTKYDKPQNDLVESRFKVIRVYRHGKSEFEKATGELELAFAQGWQFVRASEYVPDTEHYPGYIEYILYKEIN